MAPPTPDFWDFVRSINTGAHPGAQPGAGIDHQRGPPAPFGFPFGPHFGPNFGPNFTMGPHPPHWGPPPGPGGHHRHPHGGRHRGGRHGHPHHPEGETTDRATAPDEAMPDAASTTIRGDNDNENHPDPPEEAPGQGPAPPGYDAQEQHHPFPPWGGFFGGMRGGGCGRGRGRRGSHPRWGGRHGNEQGWQTYINEAVRAFQEGFGPNATGNNNSNNSEDDTFAPPVDVFSTGSGWVLHVALPGAKKEDVRVSWDADKGVLTIGGLIYRAGNEEFLAGLVSSERRVGMFEREVRLPPREEDSQEKQNKDEIDSEGITAKMEDGILVVNVPTVEKEWTDVKKVDIM